MCSHSSEITYSLSMVNYFVWELLKNYFPKWKIWMKMRTFWSGIKILGGKLMCFSFSLTVQSIVLKVLSLGFLLKSIYFLWFCFCLSKKEDAFHELFFAMTKLIFFFFFALDLTIAWVSLLQQLTITPKDSVSLTYTYFFNVLTLCFAPMPRLVLTGTSSAQGKWISRIKPRAGGRQYYFNLPPCSFRTVPEAVWQFSALASGGRASLCNHSWNSLFHLLP